MTDQSNQPEQETQQEESSSNNKPKKPRHRDIRARKRPLIAPQPLPNDQQAVTEFNSSLTTRLSMDDMVKRRRLILREYAKGYTTEQLSTMFRLNDEAIEREIAQAFSLVTHYFTKPKPHHTFVRYATFQFDIIRQLQEAHDSIMKAEESQKGGRQVTAAISALRMQSDVMDKVISKGIEFGVIQKSVPDDLAAILRMSSSDLKIELRQEIRTLTILLDSVDDEQVQTFRHKRNDKIDGYKIIRKPLENEKGVIIFGQDWKRKKHLYTTQGQIIPKYKLTDEQKELLDNKEQLLELEQIAIETRAILNSQPNQNQQQIDIPEDDTLIEHFDT